MTIGMLALPRRLVRSFVELVQFQIAVLKLLVDRREFLVDRLEFLLGGFQLFVRALQLLVAGEDLLVGRFQLFVGGVVLLDDRLLLLSRGDQLPPELNELAVAVIGRCASGGSIPDVRRRDANQRLSQETRPRELAPGRGPAARPASGRRCPDCGRAPSNRTRKQHSLMPGSFTGTTLRLSSRAWPSSRTRTPSRWAVASFRLRLVEGALQIDVQALAGHLEKIQARHARRGLEVRARPPAELEDFQRMVDQHAGRSVLTEDDPIGLLLQIRRAGGGLRRRFPPLPAPRPDTLRR